VLVLTAESYGQLTAAHAEALLGLHVAVEDLGELLSFLRDFLELLLFLNILPGLTTV